MFCQLCFKKGQQFATINNQHRKMLQKIDGPIIPTTLSQKYICPSCEKNLITCFQTLLAVEWKQVMLLNNEQSEEMLCRIKNRSRELSSIPVMTTFNKPSYFTIIPNSKQTENISLESNAAETAKQIELKTETDMDNIGAASAHGSIGGNNVYKMECKSELPKTVFGQSECKTEADTELVKVEDPANMENDFSEIIKFYWDNQLSQKSNAVKDSPAENQQTVYNLITEETANDLTNESWSFNSDEIIDVEQYVGDDDKDNNQQSALVCRKSYPVDDEDVAEIETFEITDYGNESGKSFPMKIIKTNTKAVAEVESSFSSHTTKMIDYGIAAGKSLIKKSYKSKTDGSKILDYGNEISKSLLKKSNQTITKVTAANEKTDGSITFKFENYGNIKAVTGVETTVGSKTHEINNYGNEAEKSFPKKISKSNIKVVSGPIAYKTHINFDYGNEAAKSFPKKISKPNIKVVSGPVAYKTHGNFDYGNEAEKSFPKKISKSNIKVVSIPIGSKTHINFDYGNEPEKSFPMKISKQNIKVVPALEKTVGYKTHEIFDYGNESEKSFPMKISIPKIKVVPALEKTVGYKNHGILDKSFSRKISKSNMKVVYGSVGSKTQGNFDDGNESDKSFPATTISKSNIKIVPVPEKTVSSKTHVINNYFSNAENNFSNKSNNTNTIVRAESTEKTKPFEIINFDKEVANNLSKKDTAVTKCLDKPSIALKTQSKSLNLETSDKLIETSSKTPQNFLAAFIAAQKNVNNDKVVNEVTHRVLVYKSSTAQSKKKCKPIKKSNNSDSDSDSSQGWWSRYYSNMSFPKTRKSSKKNSASTVKKKQTINCIRTKPQRLYPAAKKANMLRLPPSHSASKRRKFFEEPVIKSYQAAYLQSMVATDFIEKQIPVSSSDDFCGFGVEDDDPISIPAASIVPQKSKQIFTYKKSFRRQGNFYFCKLCSKSQKFTNVISMRYHIKFYHFAVGLECLECGKLCRSHTLLLKHFTAKHNSNEKLKFKTILIKKHKTLQKMHKTGIFRKKMDRNTNAKNETPEQKLKQIKTLRKGLAKNKKKLEKIIKTKTANNRIEQIVSKNAEMIKSKITKPSMEIIEGFEMTRLPTMQSGNINKTEISKERLVLALNKAMNAYKIVESLQENPIEAKKHRQSLCIILPQAKELNFGSHKSSRENVVIEIPKQIMTSAENSMENVSKAKSPKLETFVNADFTNVVDNLMSLQSKKPADTLEAENIRKSQRFDYVNSTENASITKSPKVKTIVGVDRTSLPFKKPADTLEAENIRKSKRFNPEENASETKSTNLKIFVNTDVNPKFLQSKNPADEQEAENILKSKRFSYANSIENVSATKSTTLETSLNSDFINDIDNQSSLLPKKSADQQKVENLSESKKSTKLETSVNTDFTNSIDNQTSAEEQDSENMRRSKRFCYANSTENASPSNSTKFETFVNAEFTNSIDSSRFLQSKKPADELNAKNIRKSERFNYANSTENVSVPKSTALETSLNADTINGIDRGPCMSLQSEKLAEEQESENMRRSKRFSYANSIENARASNSTKLETFVNAEFTNSIDNSRSLQSKKPADEQDAENIRKSKRLNYANSTENVSATKSTTLETSLNTDFIHGIDNPSSLLPKKSADQQKVENVSKSKKSKKLETSVNTDFTDSVDNRKSLQSQKPAEQQDSENMRRSKRFIYANSTENARPSNSTKLETFVNAEFTNSIDNLRSLQSKKLADEPNAENIRKSKRLNYANSTENVSATKSTTLETSLNADFINDIDNQSSLLPQNSADQQKVKKVSKSKKSTKLETSVNTDFTNSIDNQTFLQSKKPAEEQGFENMRRSKRVSYANSTENARISDSTKLETFVNAEFTNSIDNSKALQSKKPADELNAENIRKSKRLNYANSTENVSTTKSTTLETSLNADFINGIENQSSLLPKNSEDQQKVENVSKSKKSTKLETFINAEFTNSIDNSMSLQSKKSADQENVENVSKSKKSKKLETSVNTDFTNSIDNQKSLQYKKPSEEQNSENMRRSKRFRYASSTENASPSNSTKLDTFVNAEFTNSIDSSKSLQSKKQSDELNSVNIRKSKRFNYANSTENVSVTKSTTLETSLNKDFIHGIDNRSSLLSKKSADQENVEKVSQSKKSTKLETFVNTDFTNSIDNQKSLQSEMPTDEQNAENHSTSNSTKLETFVNADLSYTADNRQSKNPSDTQEAKNISKSKKLRYANSSKNASTSKSPEMETFVKSNFNASERHNSASSTENVNKSKSSKVKNATTDHNRPVQSTITSDAHHAENIRRSKRFNFENNIQKVNENNYICSRCGPEKSLNYIFYNDILQHIRLHHQPNEIVNKKNSADPEADEFKSFTTQSKAEELKSLNTEFEADESKSLMNKQSDDNAFQDINPESDEEIQIPCENDSIIGEYITEPQPSGIECQDDKSNPTENATPPSPIVKTPPQFATAPPPIANFIKKLGPRHYICTHCSESKSYACKLNVRQHIKYCHYGYRYMCTKCSKSFTNTKILRRHYGEQHKCEPFTGPFKFERPAKYQFTASPKISKFSNTFTKVGNKNYNCCLCPAGTSSKYASELSVRQHIKFKHFGYRYFCSECNWNFQMPKSLQKHYREKHSIENGLIKLRKSNSGIIQPNPKEITIYDNTYKKLNHRDYICLICTDSKSYRSATSARQHVKLCHYGFSYACTECCRTYSLPKFLLRHYRLEHKMENVPKMKFEIPGNGPAILKSRKISKFANTFKKLDKNFICKICKKSREYASEMSVRQHVKYCHFDYRYSCSECAKKFTLSVHLRKHYKLEHNIENGLIQFLPPKSSDEQCVEDVAQQADLRS